MYNTRYKLIFLFRVLVVECVSLGLADLLDHHLLCGLRPNSLRHLLGIQGNAVVASADSSVFPINLYQNLFVFAVVLLGSGNQRGLDTLEDDLLVDVLIAVDRVNDPQQFAGVHRFSLSPLG